jgi:hypothetical protein
MARWRSAWRGEIFRAQAVADLGIAAQRAGAAARNVGQGQIED